jgi:hypothetical protein
VLGYDVTDLELELWRRHLYGQIGLDRFGRPVPCFMAARTSDLDPQLLPARRSVRRRSLPQRLPGPRGAAPGGRSPRRRRR